VLLQQQQLLLLRVARWLLTVLALVQECQSSLPPSICLSVGQSVGL
jgi:hypothetical protein